MRSVTTKKILLHKLLIFILISGSMNCFAQDQTDNNDSRTIKFNNDLLREEVYIATDREVYSAGEVIWFNSWVLNKHTQSLSSLSKILYIEILNPANKPTKQVAVLIKNGSGSGQLELDDSLSSGVYTINAYTNWMKNFLPENSFTKNIEIYNPAHPGTFRSRVPSFNIFDSASFIDSNKPALKDFLDPAESNNDILNVCFPERAGARSKIILDLELKDNPEHKNSTACLSVSVAPLCCKAKNNYTAHPANSLSYLFSENHYPGNLATMAESIGFKHKPENEGHIIAGTLTENDGFPTRRGEIVVLSVPGKNPLFQYTKTDAHGRFSFKIPIRYGITDLIIQSYSNPDNSKIIIDSPFYADYLQSETRIDSIVNEVPDCINDIVANHQIGLIYESNKTSVPDSLPLIAPVTIKRFYGKPDVEIILKDWQLMQNIEEIFFEIIPNVRLRKTGSVFKIEMTDSYGNLLYDSPPVMMIDGVVIFDPGLIAGLDPEKVEKIDIIKRQYMVGEFLFNGIVNIITINGDFRNIPLPQSAVRIPLEILDPPRRFAAPAYTSQPAGNSHEPDFRNTLYWNPEIQINSDKKTEIEFWSSDKKGLFQICIQGVLNNNRFICIKDTIMIQ